MSWHSTYEFLRHFADSWGLLAMTLVWIGLAAWPFRPGAREHNTRAATMIFEDQNDGE
ncbi:cbb3-type cytochrome c oxidase subunit 3 [Alteraurantiacibacter aquimixticola]|uniref:Cbb3-type cytochrome c oxidase subunit 3 n=1 Tax=Alteraurantiacibacter aquimixticola TaxID=2489173 RepID=A0A4T3F6C5_9SPHN|nr:cbb3-type cytochrome c oxidase subunit 3 [Alteraurantiacibacter aquimixticola]TIX51984.1 cbb3-type cytochrome c oxidase subunit 3 [Alteraurantiacibacter aquimixticola]